MRTKKATAAVAFAAAVLAATACGSSGKHSTPSAPTSTSAAATSTSAQPVTSTTTGSKCVSTADIDQWSVTRRAMQLIVLPVANFDVSGMTPLIHAGIGGLLFLGGASTPSNLHAQLSAAYDNSDLGAIPLVMADVEGGGVQRLTGAVNPFPWPRDQAATMSVSAVQSLAQTVGQQMAAAGVTVDLAPVVDLDNRPGPSASNPDGQRSFSIDPTITSNYGDAFMQGLRNGGVVPVMKHFPGLGGSTQNTDYGPAATQPIAALQSAGLKPFIAAIAAGAPAIMISNAYVPGLTTKPSSVSPAVIQTLLRNQLGFSGLVMTDSLSAGALSQAGYTVPQAAVASIEAGGDMILFGSTLTPAATAMLSPPNVQTTRDAIVGAMSSALQSRALTSTRLDEAVSHVLAVKGYAICNN